MKKFKCPKCGNLSNSILRHIYGSCIEDVFGNRTHAVYDTLFGDCEECGYSAGVDFIPKIFTIVDVDENGKEI